MHQHDVVIVGSGTAGLSAARALKDRGVSSLIVEARDRVGGRTHTRPLAGYPETLVDVGGTYIHLHHQHTIAREVNRYALPVTEDEGAVNASCFVIGGRARLGVPVPVEEIAFLEKAITRVAEASRRVSAAVPFADQSLADLDIGFDQFFAPLHLPDASQEFLRGFIGQPLQCDPAGFSMLHVLSWVDAFGSFTDSFFGIAGERFTNGMAEFTGAMLADSEADLVLDSPVGAIVQEGDRVTVGTEDGAKYSARACIVAMPSHLLSGVEFAPGLSEAKQQVLDKRHEFMTLGFKTYFVVENAIPGLFGIAGIGGEDEPRIGWLFEDRDLGDGKTLLVAWGRGPGFDGDVAEAQKALSVYMPDAKVIALDGHDWAQDPRSRGIIRLAAPGQGQTFSSVMRAPEGPISFAGSDTAFNPWTGWIEGAVASGQAAAAQAIETLRL